MALTPTTLDPYYFDEVEWGPVPCTLSTDGLTATITDKTQTFYCQSLFSATGGKYYVEMSYPARVGATELGTRLVLRNGFTNWGSDYTQPDFEAAGTIGLYFDLDNNIMAHITPAGAVVEQVGFMPEDGVPSYVALDFAIVVPQTADGWVATFNFGATPFVHTPPAGYVLGFGAVAVDENGAALICPSPTVIATGTTVANTAYLVSPSPSIGAFGGASSALAAPTTTLASASGAQAKDLNAPSPRLIAYGHDSTGEQAAYLTAPNPTLTITTGANSTNAAPRPTLTTSATVTTLAKATLSAPVPALIATGTVTELATATLSAPSPNLVGYGGAVCSVSVTGKPTITATGTTGGVASVAVTCPLFELTSTASIGNVATANLLAPSPELGRTAQAWLTAPSARLTAIGSAVITATYEAYAVNLGHRPRVTNQELPIDEVTHYTNFPFTHVVRYKNSYYGANSTGLYLLEGTTDDGTAIPWAVKTAMDDFKTPVKKTVAAAYFSGRFGPASTVQLHAGEDAPNTYSFSTPRDTLAQNHRQVFGKGVKERYFALGASGTGTVELDTIELETHNMTRRI